MSFSSGGFSSPVYFVIVSSLPSFLLFLRSFLLFLRSFLLFLRSFVSSLPSFVSSLPTFVRFFSSFVSPTWGCISSSSNNMLKSLRSSRRLAKANDTGEKKVQDCFRPSDFRMSRFVNGLSWVTVANMKRVKRFLNCAPKFRRETEVLWFKCIGDQVSNYCRCGHTCLISSNDAYDVFVSDPILSKPSPRTPTP